MEETTTVEDINTSTASETTTVEDNASASETTTVEDNASASETTTVEDNASASETTTVEDNASASETTTVEDNASASETTTVEDNASASETTTVEDNASASETTTVEDNASASETTTVEDNASASETTTVEDNASASETTTVEDNASASETTTVEDNASASETTTVEDNASASETSPCLENTEKSEEPLGQVGSVDEKVGSSLATTEETAAEMSEKAALESSTSDEKSKSSSTTCTGEGAMSEECEKSVEACVAVEPTADSGVEETALHGENAKKLLPDELVDRINGVIYGNCIGDAIGLLTEFMSKKQARMVYGAVGKHLFKKDVNLEYNLKSNDSHRIRWTEGDWTDDSDQMLLILIALVEKNGQFDEKLFASKLKFWSQKGFPELNDLGGMGLGTTTGKVLRHRDYILDPHKAAHDIWEDSGRFLAPNGGVMRTSILGTMEFHDLKKVIANTRSACMVTHADPRCIASCIAVTVAIALMFQGKHMTKDGEYDVDAITKEAHEQAEKEIEDEGHRKELRDYMFEKKLEKLKLDESSSIGYTLKCLGAGFWAFRQKDFREAIQKITMEGGDADTNCAVAGALLGCKVGFSKLPETWITGLTHRGWLDDHIERYLALLSQQMSKEA